MEIATDYEKILQVLYFVLLAVCAMYIMWVNWKILDRIEETLDSFRTGFDENSAAYTCRYDEDYIKELSELVESMYDMIKANQEEIERLRMEAIAQEAQEAQKAQDNKQDAL